MKINSLYLLSFVLVIFCTCDTRTEYEGDIADEEVAGQEWDTIEQPVSRNVPPTVIDAFEGSNPNVGNVEWYIDENNNYSVFYESRGERYASRYDQEGAWQETRKEIDWEDAPPSIRSAYSSGNNNGWMVYRIYEVEVPDRNEKVYSVRLKKEVYFDESGKVKGQYN